MRISRKDPRSLAISLAAILLASAATPAVAQDQARQPYHLQSGPLIDTLRAIATATGRSVVAPAPLLEGKTAPAVDGALSADDALGAALAGSGLRARRVSSGFVIETGTDDARTVRDTPVVADDVVVTGSRIHGASVASPVIRISRRDAQEAGQATLGELVRSIPQSFGGGQNPGIGFNVPSASGADVGGGSSINLRGLGSDATLTLLNGHRLAYGGSRQAVDVSVIPLDALDRIEIVADGASALYGSDAVGGVANIILRHDLQGVETRARIGAATDGGDIQQQYDVTAGDHWSTGGFLAAYEYNDATAIEASQRDYAATRSPGLRLLPATRSNNALFSGHQNLTPDLEFAIDGLYNVRDTLLLYPANTSGNLALSRTERSSTERSYVVAPSLSWHPANGATVSLSGSYGEDRVDYSLVNIVGSATPAVGSAGCYCNRMAAVELGGDTPVIALPGGSAKLALGTGIRWTSLTNIASTGVAQTFDKTLDTEYGYAELDLPFLSPANGVAGVRRLVLDAAIRYERYTQFGSIATPKLGLIWSPANGIDLQASWGQSFRAPTLLERYQPVAAILFPASTIGGSGYPAGATALYVQGGNASLKPERADSWSMSAEWKPAALAGLDIELSYFSTRYTDRIVTPIGFLTQSLSDPLYSAQVTRSPSADTVQVIAASAATFQLAGAPSFNPANVVAIVDNTNVNAGRQTIHGIDALVTYHTDLGARDSLTVNGNATYLVSRQQITIDQPITQLAGVLFNPPHWRARATLDWRHASFGASTSLNYTGNLRDIRTTPALLVPGQTRIDLALRYRASRDPSAMLNGLELILAVQNLLDTPPPPIVTGPITDAPYDSTNYSPVGRFVSLTIAKTW